MPIAIVEKTIHVPSGNRAEYFAITRLPATKPTEVRPSWRPYSNSVAWRASMANGRRITFQRPNERKIGAPEMNSERRIGVRREGRDAVLQVRQDDADARLLLGLDLADPDEDEAGGREEERQRVQVERPVDVERGRQQARQGEADRGRPERADHDPRVRRGELLVRRDLRQQGVVGRVEELRDRADQRRPRRTGRRCRPRSGRGS